MYACRCTISDHACQIAHATARTLQHASYSAHVRARVSRHACQSTHITARISEHAYRSTRITARMSRHAYHGTHIGARAVAVAAAASGASTTSICGTFWFGSSEPLATAPPRALSAVAAVAGGRHSICPGRQNRLRSRAPPACALPETGEAAWHRRWHAASTCRSFRGGAR